MCAISAKIRTSRITTSGSLLELCSNGIVLASWFGVRRQSVEIDQLLPSREDTMTSNSSTSHVVDWPSSSAAAQSHFDLRRLQPDHQGNRSQIALGPTMQSPEVEDFESDLRRRLVGQDRAIRQYGAGLPGPPGGSFCTWPPTGQPPAAGAHRLRQDAIGRSSR